MGKFIVEPYGNKFRARNTITGFFIVRDTKVACYLWISKQP